MLESIFFPRLALRQVKPLTFVLTTITAVFVFLLLTSQAFAAAAPVITGAVTSDADNDGTVDTITVSFSPNAQIIDTGAGADGLDSLTIGGGCTGIANGNYASASTASLVLTVSGCTAGNTAITPTVTYVAVAGCGTNFAICNADASAQLVGLTPNATATDGAAPVLMSVVAGTGTLSSLTYNTVALTYSEAVQISSNGGSSWATTGTVVSSATLGAMTTAKTLAGLATFNGSSDVTNAAATDNSVGVSTTTVTVYFNAQATGYFSVAGTAPTTDTYSRTSSVTAVKDLAGIAVNAAGPTRVATNVAWDITKPTVANTYSCDANHDGRVEEMQINFSESVLDAYLNTNVASFELDQDTTNNGINEETAATFNTSTNGCDTLAADTTANNNKVRVDLTTGIVGTHVQYLNVAAAAVRDIAGNRIVAADNAGVETDEAQPVLVLSSPATGATGVSRTATIVLTFSENMNETVGQLTYTQTGGSNTYTPVWSSNGTYSGVANNVVTLTPIGSLPSGYHTFTITAAPANNGAVTTFYGAISGSSTITNPFHFSVISSSSSSSSTTTVSTPSYIMLVTAPNGGEELIGGTTQNITWSSSQTNSSAMNNVNIAYTTDSGVTYTSIATNELNDGTYSWLVPNISAQQVTVKVSGTDLVSVLASDSSDSEFSISPTAIIAISTGNTGVSPVTGLVEDISVVAFGDYIKSSGYDTVYYVAYAADGSTLIRRPFNDSQTFFTYQDNFNNVVNVTDATLPTLTLGKPMMPKPGVVLVKIQSVNKVYAIGTSGELRWVITEEPAGSIYGSNWADYVIDIPDTLYPYFTHGTDITTDENIDVSGMKTRAEVNM